MNTPDNLIQCLAHLRNSPTFAMSLGGKELFHTNFLSFILESDNPQILNSQQKLLRLLFATKDGDIVPTRVITWRERSHLDLVVIPAPLSIEDKEPSLAIDENDTRVIAVVIEAKLKSIPTTEQLKTYTGKLKDGLSLPHSDQYKILVKAATKSKVNGDYEWTSTTLQLAKVPKGRRGKMSPPIPDCLEAVGRLSTLDEEDDDVNQSIKRGEGRGTIKRFLGRVRRVLVTPHEERPDYVTDREWDWIPWSKIADQIVADEDSTQLLSQLLRDYREQHLNNLLRLLRGERQSLIEAMKSGDKQYGEFYDQMMRKPLIDLRLHDLVGKYISYELGMILSGKIAKSEAPENNDIALEHYTLFSNQQAGFAFEWIFKPVHKKRAAFSFGIQVQGTDYRHFVSTNFECDALEKIAGLFGNWLYRSIPNVGQLKGKKKDNNQLLAFNRDKFLYTVAQIGHLKMKYLPIALEESLSSGAKVFRERRGEIEEIVVKALDRIGGTKDARSRLAGVPMGT